LLPDIGLLHLIRNVAKRSYQENKLYPPSFAVALNPLDRPDPSLYSVVSQIAFSQGVPVEEAEKKWAEAARAIREKLSTGSSVELTGLGYLNLNEKGRISFTPFHHPLPLYEAAEGGHEKPAPAAAEEPAETAVPVAAPAEEIEAAAVGGPAAAAFEEPRPRPSRARWWIAGSIVVLLLTGWFTYRGTLMRKEKATAIRHIIRKEKTTKGIAAIDSMKLRADSDSVARETAADIDSLHYDIIFAVYQSRERAEHQFRKMRGWGHPVVLITKDSSLYELGLPFTSLAADTAVNLEKMKALYGDRVHIEYRLRP
jgi:hypothetical protein